MGRTNLRTESTLCRSHLLSIIKRSIKFVVSFSLLSFLVSYFSLITLFLRSSYSWDKNYMFLLCNGILVILGSNSGLFGGTSSDITGEHLVKNVPIQPPESTKSESESEPEAEAVADAEQEVAMICEGEEVINNGFLIPARDDRDDEFSIVICEDKYEEQQERRVLSGFEEEEETELMSAEELNKKCDEFIKKMKQGIKWESQQLVMVR